jgi:CRISPR/Cas system endoribonuclease Cas6 (RAMP superfamily)
MDSKEELVKLYCERDTDIKLDLYKLIINHLQKLNYNYIDKSLEIKNFMIYTYTCNLRENKINLKSISYNDWIKTFITSNEYLEFYNNLDYRLKRIIQLSKFSGSNKNKEFYEACTLHELTFLGY